MSQDRREKIIVMVQTKGEVTLRQLEEVFPHLSSMTLRRDLAYLEEKGYLKRTRGGAIAVERLYHPQEDIYSLRAVRNVDKKMAIARLAVTLTEPGRAMFIDSGTTMMCLANVMPDDSYNILTSGPNIALELMKNQRCSVTLLGGQISRTTLSASGVHALEFLNRFNIDLAFMATSGFSLESGFTSGIYNESELKSAVMAKARYKVLLMDASKMDRNLPFTFARLEDIDVLVCDEPLPDAICERAQQLGVKLLFGNHEKTPKAEVNL